MRFLGNRSSGRQGYALARAAVARGAAVVLVSANVALQSPAGAELVRVETAEQMRAAVLDAATSADAVVMAAAVADFRPADRQQYKIKKGEAEPDTIPLTRNPDILAELCEPESRAQRSPQVLVGFAAETGTPDRSVLEHGQDKLRRKKVDLLVVNEVGEDAGIRGAGQRRRRAGCRRKLDRGARDHERPARAPGVGPRRGPVVVARGRVVTRPNS